MEEIISFVKEQMAGNEFFSAGISVSIFTAAMYQARALPSKIWAFMKMVSTTKITISNDDFHFFSGAMLHLQESKTIIRQSSFNIISKRVSDWDERSDSNKIGIGYGIHYYKLGKYLCRVNYYTDNEVKSFEKPVERIEITALTRRSQKCKQDLFGGFIHKAQRAIQSNDMKLYRSGQYGWDPVSGIPKRSLDTVYVDTKAEICDAVGRFLESKESCLEKGIPWRLSMILSGPPGTGKCLGVDEMVLMYDGSVKRNGDLQVGDILVGPDSKPRRILSANNGSGTMYKITPRKGRSWTCNGDHILSLRKSGKDDIVHMTVRDYIKGCTGRDRLKQWRVGVEYPERNGLYDPYAFGVWLGDGTKTKPEITLGPKKKKPIIDYMMENVQGCKMKYYESNPSTVTLRYSLFTDLGLMIKELGGEKNIPMRYLISSRSQRLKLLAGLLDTDGYNGGGYIEITQESLLLSNSIVKLVRSLGMAAYMSEKVVNGKPYWRINISGDIDQIPCITERMKFKKRKQVKNVLNVGFKIEEIGHGQWRGIVIDGDRQFLLDDFTVTHNTSLSMALAGHYDIPMYYLSLNSVKSDSQLLQLVSEIPPKSVIMIEDVDCANSKSRSDKKKNNDDNGVSMSGLLNALDGIMTPHGRVLIMTTNHYEKLDPAMTRAGRADYHFVMDKLNLEGARKMANKICPDKDISDEELTGKTGAELEVLLKEYM